jgi:hypothetical protein
MKKKFLLMLSSMLVSIGILVGCSGDNGEPGFPDEEPTNEMPSETGETEADSAADESTIGVDMDDNDDDEFSNDETDSFDDEFDDEELDENDDE